MAQYCVEIGFGVRRHGMATPEVGPCTPPYLSIDQFARWVWVEAEGQVAAELLAFDIANILSMESNAVLRREYPQPGSRPSLPGAIVVAADMITSCKVVEAVL